MRRLAWLEPCRILEWVGLAVPKKSMLSTGVHAQTCAVLRSYMCTELVMSSDHPGSSRSFFNYFPRSRSSSECAPSSSNEASLPESDLSSNEKECTPELASSLE